MDLVWIVGLVALAHLFLAPYTKVEESFNIQACHDLLYNGIYLNEYDHHEFPGTVPRTFIGPLAVSAISAPFVFIIRILGLSKLYAQYIVRGVLGLFVLLALKKFCKELSHSFGSTILFWFILISISQFHFIYYFTRPLANIFALIFVLLAYAFWFKQNHRYFILTSGISIIIFRFELCLLLGPIILFDLVSKRISLVAILKYSIIYGSICLLATVVIDSLFWGRVLWPEGEVVWFNAYLNQSHLWGTSPFLWYWYSAIPRALGLSCTLVPFGIYFDKRIQIMVFPALVYIILYSFLPHKELRFIIYVFPLLNVAAARACHYFWENRGKSTLKQLMAGAFCLHLLANAGFTLLLLSISAKNYPGGEAMHQLHSLIPPEVVVNVHIDNYAAQTGVTRFTQLHSHWRYNKTDNLKAGSRDLRRFTHMLVEAKTKYSYNLKHYVNSHEVVTAVDAFSHINFNYHTYPPIKVRAKPALFILKNLEENFIDWSWMDPYNVDTKNSEFYDASDIDNFKRVSENNLQYVENGAQNDEDDLFNGDAFSITDNEMVEDSESVNAIGLSQNANDVGDIHEEGQYIILPYVCTFLEPQYGTGIVSLLLSLMVGQAALYLVYLGRV